MNWSAPCRHVRVLYNAQSISASIHFHCDSSRWQNPVERQNWVVIARSGYGKKRPEADLANFGLARQDLMVENAMPVWLLGQSQYAILG